MPLAIRTLLLTLLAFALAAVPASAASPSAKLYACVTKSYKTLNLVSAKASCPKGESKVSWSVQGPAGPKGPAGTRGRNGTDGNPGAPGAKGDKGDIGTTGTNGAAGATGSAGANGANGADGTPADLSAYQQRVTGVCAAGTFLQSIAVDGSAGCARPVPTLPLALSDSAPTAAGLSVALTDTGNPSPAIQVNRPGPGYAISVSSGANGVYAAAGSVSAAAMIGDNAHGEGIVARVGSACTDGSGINCSGIGGVVGRNDGRGGIGVRGFSTSPSTAFPQYGVLGQAGISGTQGVGVRAENVNVANPGNALEAVTNSTAGGNALYAQGPSQFSGDVTINGNLTVTGTKSGFHIDDPRAPTARTLTNTPLETDALMVQYTGNVRTDAHGRATVTLPSYASALASDWRYQLTPIGTFDDVVVEHEVRGNAFTIRSRHGATKVSWTVTGVRVDPQARANPIVPVQPKTGEEHGRYLDPGAYGKPASDGSPSTARVPTGSGAMPSAQQDG
jgi:hypothetical protein